MAHQFEGPKFDFYMPTSLNTRQLVSRPGPSMLHAPRRERHPQPQQRTKRYNRLAAKAGFQERAHAHGEDREVYRLFPPERPATSTTPKRRLALGKLEKGGGALIERRPFVRQRLMEGVDVYMMDDVRTWYHPGFSRR